MSASPSRPTASKLIHRLGRTLGICLVLASVSAGSALADAGGTPHGGLSSCGVGSSEAHEFIANPESSGASEINEYPPVEYGCTGSSK
jgi:hypothetical protein